jgi:Fur family ferric uptake transcriptional regulator
MTLSKVAPRGKNGSPPRGCAPIDPVRLTNLPVLVPRHTGSSTPDAESVVRLKALFREHGLKLTLQRRIVLEVLEASTDEPSAYEIHRRIGHDRPVGVATVYRALNSLVDAGLVSRQAAENGTGRYAVVGRGPRHQLVDVVTGRIITIDDSRLRPLISDVAARMGFRLVEYRLKMFGQRQQK